MPDTQEVGGSNPSGPTKTYRKPLFCRGLRVCGYNTGADAFFLFSALRWAAYGNCSLFSDHFLTERGLSEEQARYYQHAFRIIEDFAEAGSFPGGYTRAPRRRSSAPPACLASTRAPT